MARPIVFIPLLCALFAYSCPAAEAEEPVTCRGTVVDSAGEPVAEAQVQLFAVPISMHDGSLDFELVDRVTTDRAGRFVLRFAKKPIPSKSMGLVLAKKAGAALGWYLVWEVFLGEDVPEMTIALDSPANIEGRVVNAAGEPIAAAEVRALLVSSSQGAMPNFLFGSPALGDLTVLTDESGRFVIAGVPSKASAEFQVFAEGCATIYTDPASEVPRFPLQFPAGKTDVELVLPAEAVLEGVVVVEDSGAPLSGVRLIAVAGEGRTPNPFNSFTATSDKTGNFAFDRLSGDTYTVILSETWEGFAQWCAQPLTRSVAEGERARGLRIELQGSGVLEVLVQDEGSREPIEGAAVSAERSGGGPGHDAVTDENGMARLPLPPGRYENVSVHRQESFSSAPIEVDATVKAGKTTRVKVTLAGKGQIRGRLCDEQGRPLPDATVQVIPFSYSTAQSDDQGRFELNWDRAFFDQVGFDPALSVRHVERELAVIFTVENPDKPVDLLVKPGVAICGKVLTAEGEGIASAAVQLMVNRDNWSTTYFRQGFSTDENGTYSIVALPRGNDFRLAAEANGYGRTEIDVSTERESVSPLELEPIVLHVARLSVAGRVLDEDGKPVAHAKVRVSGSGQRSRNVETDKQGSFTITNLCEGDVRLWASVPSSDLSGDVRAEAGSTGIEIVVGTQRTSRARIVPEAPKLLGKELPSLAALADGEQLEAAGDEPVLICFCDIDQRPSRFCLRELVKKLPALEARKVQLRAVDLSGGDPARIQAWAAQNGVRFPLVALAEDQDHDQIRRSFGIRGLPWLILTDSSHIVGAEGFGIGELDESQNPQND